MALKSDLRKCEVDTEKFIAVLDRVVKARDVDGVEECVKYLVEQVGEAMSAIVVAKPVLAHLAEQLQELSVDDNEFLGAASQKALAILQPKASYYPSELLTLSQGLSEVLQADGDFHQAARIMSRVDVEDMRSLTPAERLDWHVRTAGLYLEVKDTVSASTYIKKAQRIFHSVPEDDLKTRLMFFGSYARILDAERRFLDAAMRYMELSQMPAGDLIPEDDLLIALQHAVTCAVLGKAGPSRARVLAMLFRDERASRLSNYRILEKMYKNRILRGQEVDNFAKMLEPHQQAELAGGVTVLQKAVNEHNLLAASRIYNNITFSELATILGVAPVEAEAMARNMIEEGRLPASIDQVDEIIEFESREQSAGGASTGASLLEWDDKISELCTSMNEVIEHINRRHPQYEL